MISVSVEVCEGSVARRVRISASSIELALKQAGDGKPGCRVRLLFPIDPEAFFVPENFDRGRHGEPRKERIAGRLCKLSGSSRNAE